jgi:hypothetical protein
MSVEFQIVSDHIEQCIVSLSTDKLNPAKLFLLTIQTIEYLDKEYHNLNGQQKKELLIEAFNDLCDNTKHESLTKEIKETIGEFIKEDLVTVVESVIQLSRGEFQINEKQEALLVRCIIKLCKCLVKNNNKSRP